MDNSIYEVTREEYIDFINQIKEDARLTETIKEDCGNLIKTYSAKNGVHFCSRVIPENEEEEERYYIFNMPEAEEKCPPKHIWRITLETKE